MADEQEEYTTDMLKEDVKSMFTTIALVIYSGNLLDEELQKSIIAAYAHIKLAKKYVNKYMHWKKMGMNAEGLEDIEMAFINEYKRLKGEQVDDI